MTYFASTNLLALSSELCAKLGTMSTVLAGYITLWCNFDFLPALVSYPVGISNTLCDSSSVGINSSPVFPAVGVAPESTTACVHLFSCVLSICSFVCTTILLIFSAVCLVYFVAFIFTWS